MSPAPLLDAALACLARGWWVFPCLPRAKNPATKRGLHEASNQGGTLLRWWTDADYNPAINLGLSNLTVLDVDTGLESREDAHRFCERFPRTFTVRTGRRPGWGIQLYFTGLAENRPYDLTGQVPGLGGRITGEVRSTGYYVLAPGAIHDKTGEPYLVLRDLPPVPVPPLVLELTRQKLPKPVANATEKVTPSARHYYLTARAVELFSAGLAGDGLVAGLRWLNEHRCDPPKRIAGELEALARWAEQNITPGLFKEDTSIIARLLVEDERWKAAWEANLAPFNNDAGAAFEHLVGRLFAQENMRTWQVERICKAAPLHRLLEREQV